MIRRLAVTIVTLLTFVLPASVAAYSPSNAANYADTWWSSNNAAWPYYSSDCANFVSQSVFAGGYPMHYGQTNPWYAYYNYGWYVSQSWRLVQYNNGFFINDGGYVVNTYYGVKTAPTNGVQGDIVYYSWSNDHTFVTDGHEAIITVTSGLATSTSDVGALVTAHTENRYHEYWTLWFFNRQWPNTYYQVVHLVG